MDSLRAALAEHQPNKLEVGAGKKWAAVAAIVRAAPEGPELLFIHRSEDPRDPWSGHMAFPGGRVDAGDNSRLETALRETREEVNLDLDQDGHLLARLSDLPAIGRGRPMNLAIAPFVFEVQGSPELIGSHEVADIVWVPLSFLMNPQNVETMKWERFGQRLDLPCYRFNGHVIWGLTFVMLEELLGIVKGDSGNAAGMMNAE
ncbi:MAG: CoA pyrophosphatase [bacterium]|nr:CoA pyrophosphatase [bacterium]